MKIDGECLIELIGSCRNKVQVYRSVRMPQLHTLLHFHLTPIVMRNGSSRRDLLLLNSQNFCRSIPAILLNSQNSIPGPLVLGKGPLNALTPTPDMDRTVSRRSEPSSRTALMGEQPNPWNILQPQVAKSRHRDAKPSRRSLPEWYLTDGSGHPRKEAFFAFHLSCAGKAQSQS
ncbi:hypothetical protein MLD38_040524 [Melastoma candidum]|nr:hypothetical protein MLD38_040524 [Melastoma candidum]